MATTSPMIGSPISKPLKLAQGVRVEAHKSQNRATQGHECDVEHDRLLCEAVLSADRHKLSIANGAAGHKDFVSFRPAVREQGPTWPRGGRERSDPSQAKGQWASSGDGEMR